MYETNLEKVYFTHCSVKVIDKKRVNELARRYRVNIWEVIQKLLDLHDQMVEKEYKEDLVRFFEKKR